MTSKEFRDRLDRRARAAGLAVPAPLVERLDAYVQLLARWNARINLTSLPVNDLSDEALDRLLIEPLAAARYVDDGWTPWFDVGSGGGSPAVPLRLAKPALRLTMVESRSRKAAFLREAVRVLELGDVDVEAARFEDLAVQPERAGSAGLVTIRAVRAETEILAAADRLLRQAGRLAVFHTSDGPGNLTDFVAERSESLALSDSSSVLAIYRRASVPRGTVDRSK